MTAVIGGWVRDKILGRPTSYDIDLALDNMQGKEFADKINIWYKRKGNLYLSMPYPIYHCSSHTHEVISNPLHFSSSFITYGASIALLKSQLNRNTIFSY